MTVHGGMITVGHTHRTNVLPSSSRVANFTNEDINFIVDLTDALANHEFYLPLPVAIDRLRETFIVHIIEFLKTGLERAMTDGTNFQALSVMMSYLDIDFPATWHGILSDTEDEAFKAIFDGQYYFGQFNQNTTGISAIEGTHRSGPAEVSIMWIPLRDLDQGIPMKIRFFNKTAAITAGTNATASADFTQWEQISLRVHYTPRRLTQQELSDRSTGMILQRLG